MRFDPAARLRLPFYMPTDKNLDVFASRLAYIGTDKYGRLGLTGCNTYLFHLSKSNGIPPDFYLLASTALSASPRSLSPLGACPDF